MYVSYILFKDIYVVYLNSRSVRPRLTIYVCQEQSRNIQLERPQDSGSGESRNGAIYGMNNIFLLFIFYVPSIHQFTIPILFLFTIPILEESNLSSLSATLQALFNIQTYRAY